jgi:hypothetical protein
MSLREMLGADVDRVYEQVDTLLDNEDAMIVLVDGSRATSYARGFGISPSQLELLALEIEKAVRNVAGPPFGNRRNRRNDGEEREDGGDSGKGVRVRRHPGRFGRRSDGDVVHTRIEGVRTGGSADSSSGRAVGRVLRLASETAATGAR